MALTQISTGMLASGDGTVDLNIDNGTFVVDVSTSRVGIGNSSPSVKLGVTGAMALSGNADFNGNLDVSGTTVSAGKITADAGIDVDNINIDGTTIALSSGDLTLDAAGSIIFESNDGVVKVKDGSSAYGAQIDLSDDNNVTISALIANRDIIFKGVDHDGINGTPVTALTLDMSAAGAATFNAGATFAGNVGIGTSSPRTRLDLGANGVSAMRWGSWSELGEESSHNTLVIGNNVYVDGNTTKVRATSSDGYRAIKMKFSDGIAFHTASGSVTADATVDNERLRIDASGNVGIGSAGASSYGKFLVDGTGNLINANASSGAATFQLYEAGAGRFGITTLNGSAGAKFTTAGTERMRIDSSGNVGINETVPFGKLHISDTQTGRTTAGSVGNLLVLEDDENGMSILSADAGAGYILFGDTASAASGGIKYDHSANKFNFRTNDAWDKMILDSSGNLLVGKTASSVSTDGVELTSTGFTRATVNGDTVLQLNRRTSDGTIINFRQDGSSVGSIGTDASGNLQTLSSSGNYRFGDSNTSRWSVDATRMYPLADATYDIGLSSVRVRDIYLSGGVNFSANANAGGMTSETLDDYEEGAWTPSLVSAGATVTHVSGYTPTGFYTKVGRLVTVNFYIPNFTLTGTTTNTLFIQALPFTQGAGSYNGGTLSAYNFNFTRHPFTAIRTYDGTRLGILSHANNATWGWETAACAAGGANRYIAGSITYATT